MGDAGSASDVRSAEAAWSKAAEMLRDPSYELVVLDELHIVLGYKYLAANAVLEALCSRPVSQHVVVTGRGAPPSIIDIANTVTDMRTVKHAFDAGIKAQHGIEL